MPHSAALRPFGFSQPTRITTKTKRRADTPVPPDDSDRTVYPSVDSSHHKSQSRRLSMPTLGPYWATPPASQPRAAALRSGLSQRTFPDEEEEEAMPPSRHSRTHEKRRPPRLQTSRHAPPPGMVSPITPTTIKMLANMQLRSSSDLSPVREDFQRSHLHNASNDDHGGIEEQLKALYSALRRVEADSQKLRDQMEAGRIDRHRVERELDETRKENRHLVVRLEEMLKNSRMKSPIMKSPLSARSDDAWGCSMYDMEVEGH